MDHRLIFEEIQVPIYQNKIHASQNESLNVERGDIQLVQSQRTGLVFNKKFDFREATYDETYQNEQGYSRIFQEHLQNVVNMLKDFSAGKKVVEIGCGKGVFLELMEKNGINCAGFDPTYEGTNPKITRDFFSKKYSNINAEVIVLRHTLEHIPNPFEFLHEIASSNNYKGKIFIEVPTFDWILEKQAFWDIFYEHCNYFTISSLSGMFKSSQVGTLFGGQYIYAWADLAELKDLREWKNEGAELFDSLTFQTKMLALKRLVEAPGKKAIWGAAAKGSTFLNLTDPKRENIEYVIDINPVKRNMYIAGTGHQIFAPEILKSRPVEEIIIMNPNYFEEIRKILNDESIKLVLL